MGKRFYFRHMDLKQHVAKRRCIVGSWCPPGRLGLRIGIEDGQDSEDVQDSKVGFLPVGGGLRPQSAGMLAGQNEGKKLKVGVKKTTKWAREVQGERDLRKVRQICSFSSSLMAFIFQGLMFFLLSILTIYEELTCHGLVSSSDKGRQCYLCWWLRIKEIFVLLCCVQGLIGPPDF